MCVCPPPYTHPHLTFSLPPTQDKRRIRENIAIKRRQIEEEKLKLQYIKVHVGFDHKALRQEAKCQGAVV